MDHFGGIGLQCGCTVAWRQAVAVIAAVLLIMADA